MQTIATSQPDHTSTDVAGASTNFTVSYRDVYLCQRWQVAALLDMVAAAMIAQDYIPACCRDLRLALEEAVVNALVHGNGDDPAKRVRVRYRVGPEAVVAEVEDEGPGFDLALVPDPTAADNLARSSGRGLLLMQHYTSWLCYHGRGNRLTFCKYREAQ